MTGIVKYAREIHDNTYVRYVEMPFEAEFECFYETIEDVIVRWDFGDNTMSDGESPTHMYDLSGVYIVKVYLLDPDTEDILSEFTANKINVVDMNIYPVSSQNIEVTLSDSYYTF